MSLIDELHMAVVPLHTCLDAPTMQAVQQTRRNLQRMCEKWPQLLPLLQQLHINMDVWEWMHQVEYAMHMNR